MSSNPQQKKLLLSSLMRLFFPLLILVSTLFFSWLLIHSANEHKKNLATEKQTLVEKTNYGQADQLVHRYIFEFNAGNTDSVAKLLCPQVTTVQKNTELTNVTRRNKIYNSHLTTMKTVDKNIFTADPTWRDNQKITGSDYWNVNIEKNCIFFNTTR